MLSAPQSPAAACRSSTPRSAGVPWPARWARCWLHSVNRKRRRCVSSSLRRLRFPPGRRHRVLYLRGAAFPPALSHRFMIFRLVVAAAARLFTALVDFVDGRPSAPFSFVLRHAALFITLFDMIGLPLLFTCVLLFIPSWHICTSTADGRKVDAKKKGTNFVPLFR